MAIAHSHKELICWQRAYEAKLLVSRHFTKELVVPIQRLAKRSSKAASKLADYLDNADPPNGPPPPRPRRPRRPRT